MVQLVRQSCQVTLFSFACDKSLVLLAITLEVDETIHFTNSLHVDIWFYERVSRIR